jgi:hypothetical protein
VSDLERLLHLLAGAPRAFWRRDVDVSLEAAARMARFDQVAGVRATYYLDPESEFYNVSSRLGRHAVNAILRAGHALGLHVDYRPELGDKGPREAMHRARERLPLALAVVMNRRVSFHMPPADVLWRDFEWCDSAYAQRWEGRYVSDSRGRLPDVELTDGMQVCLHPEWWFGTPTKIGTV